MVPSCEKGCAGSYAGALGLVQGEPLLVALRTRYGLQILFSLMIIVSALWLRT